MAKKVILKDLDNVEILPITRGELIVDSSGKEAFHSNEFLATNSLPGLMSPEDKYKLDHLEDSGPGANNKVAQINTTTNDVYRLLFSETADDEDRTEGSRKSANLTFNPSTGVLSSITFIGNIDGNYINKLTGYIRASEPLNLATTDSLNTALGKLEYKVDTTYNWYQSVTTEDTDEYINKWQEILDFLNKIDNTEGADILDEFVTRKTDQTITGEKTFSKQIISSVAQGTAPFSVTSTTVVPKLNADLLDGYNASGLFTNLSNSGNNISITIGGTNKTLTPAYATNANTVDGYHMGSWGHYKYSKTVTDTTNAVWYIKIVFNINWNSERHHIHFHPDYNNIQGRLFLSLSSYDTLGYLALVSNYNDCNIKGFYIYRDSSAGKLTMYLKLAAYTSAKCIMYSTLEISSATVVSAPSVSFIDISTANRIYTDMRIKGGGFIKNNSDDSYVLLGGGGHKTIASFQTTYDDRYVKKTGDTMTGLLTLGSNSYTKTIKWANTDYSQATAIAFMGSNGDWVVRSTYASDSSTADLRFNKSTLKINGNTALHTGNSSVSGGGSSVGSSITVNIGGTSKTLTIPSNASTASQVYIKNSSNNNVFPVIFTNTESCGTPRNDSLYVDTAKGAGYNPSTNAFVASAMTAGTHNSASTLYLDSGTATTSIIFRLAGSTEIARFAQPNGYLGLGVTSPSYRLHVSGTGYFTNGINANGKAVIDSTGRFLPAGTAYRNAGVYGVYDSTKVGHVWSMGINYAITADGSSTNNMYGLVYFHTNWSNDSTKNTAKRDGVLITEVSNYASGHQIALAENGVILSSLGSYVWSRSGFKKKGSSDDYALMGGGGHKKINNVLNTAFYKRSTSVNGTAWDMAGTNNSAAFTIFAPTTAGTSGQLLKSNGSGAPTWVNLNTITSGYTNYLNILDVRGTNHLPNSSTYPGANITAWFNNTGTPDGNWWSGITVKGWTNTYAVWQLCSYSSTGTANNYRLYHRNGINDGWGSWKAIAYTSDIPSIPSISISNSGSGNAVTSITASGHTLTVTKGSTFLTSHQSLANCLRSTTWVANPGQNADSMTYNTMNFTYANKAPYTGPIIYFGGASNGSYGLLLNAGYNGSTLIAFRTKNGDNNTWNVWHTLARTSDIGNGTVTIKQAGATKGSFTMNQSGNTTIELTDNNTTYSFTNNNPTLSWGTKSTIGTVGGVALTVTMPANPNTNTHWTTRIYAGASGTAAHATATNPYLKVTDDNTYRNLVRFVGGGATTVSSDTSGNITISSTNTWRGIQNNLTSSSTTESLSANMGKLLASYKTGTPTYNTSNTSSGALLIRQWGPFVNICGKIKLTQYNVSDSNSYIAFTLPSTIGPPVAAVGFHITYYSNSADADRGCLLYCESGSRTFYYRYNELTNSPLVYINISYFSETSTFTLTKL